MGTTCCWQNRRATAHPCGVAQSSGMILGWLQIVCTPFSWRWISTGRINSKQPRSLSKSPVFMQKGRVRAGLSFIFSIMPVSLTVWKENFKSHTKSGFLGLSMMQSIAGAALLIQKELQNEKWRKHCVCSCLWQKHLPHAAQPKICQRLWLWPWKQWVWTRGLPWLCAAMPIHISWRSVCWFMMEALTNP